MKSLYLAFMCLVYSSFVSAKVIDITKKDGFIEIKNNSICTANIEYENDIVKISPKGKRQLSLESMPDSLDVSDLSVTYGNIESKINQKDFRLPFIGTTQLTQGFLFGTHQGEQSYSADFGLEIGRAVVAVADGQVIGVNNSFDRGYFLPKYIKRANEVRICHADGTVTVYVHLLKNTALVSEGDLVKEGQIIAQSGNSGYTSGAHLHFSLWKPKSSKSYKSIPFTFNGLAVRQGDYYGDELSFSERVHNFFNKYF